MSNRSRWWHIDIEDLRTVTQRSSSFVEIIRHYGFVASGSGFRMLRSRLDSLKIDYSHIPVGLGANRGRAVFQPELGIEQVFVENSLSSRKTVKKYLLQHKLMEYKCVICGQEPSWLDKPLTLVLDHINGKNIAAVGPDRGNRPRKGRTRSHRRAGWVVESIGPFVDGSLLPDVHKAIRKHRSNTGDSLPKVK